MQKVQLTRKKTEHSGQKDELSLITVITTSASSSERMAACALYTAAVDTAETCP